ncbi:hypothetical protein [Streptomyces sp. NPDC087512]|uniref:hypothetical protein n=1 Tax=unclassified Streptomyces TaxID=2593676 RepID=UPI003419C83B
MLERPRTAERYARGAAAAVTAVAALVLAANAGPARSAEHPPAGVSVRAEPVEGSSAPDTPGGGTPVSRPAAE